MKIQILFVYGFAASFLSAQTPASPVQVPPPQQQAQQRPMRIVQNQNGTSSSGESLGANYQISLSVTAKGAEPLEISLVTESSLFSASGGDPDLNFQGSLVAQESGKMVVTYNVSWQTKVDQANGNFTWKASLARGSVSIASGESIQIFTLAGKTAKLTLVKLEAKTQ